MIEEVKWFSAKQLADLHLPMLPTSDRALRDYAKREGWPQRQVRSRGGRSGLRTEFSPPDHVMHLIVSAQGRSRTFAAREPAAEYRSEMRACDALLMMHRLVQQAGFDCPAEWRMMLLEQLVRGDITEAGALDVLKRLAPLLQPPPRG